MTYPCSQELKECCGRVFVDSAPEFFPPQPKIVDFSEVDVILISNYLCMLALPFITEGTGFAGVVYATEPTLQIGRSVKCHCQKQPVIIYRLSNEGMISGKGGSDFSLCCHTQTT